MSAWSDVAESAAAGEAGVGMLRIVGFTEDPPGIRISYKMAQGTGPAGEEAERVPAGRVDIGRRI